MVTAALLSRYLIITTDSGINGDLLCMELVGKLSFFAQLTLVAAYLVMLLAIFAFNQYAKRVNGGNPSIYLQYMSQLIISYPIIKVIAEACILLNMVVC